MLDRSIFITEYDAKRLSELINKSGEMPYFEPECLESLKAELSRARIVDSADIPADVITMNSTVCLTDVETGEEESYTLVFPQDADVTESKISVLAPIGTAILGYKVGDTLTWKVPSGERRLQINKVLYQPEAAGDYHL